MSWKNNNSREGNKYLTERVLKLHETKKDSWWPSQKRHYSNVQTSYGNFTCTESRQNVLNLFGFFISLWRFIQVAWPRPDSWIMVSVCKLIYNNSVNWRHIYTAFTDKRLRREEKNRKIKINGRKSEEAGLQLVTCFMAKYSNLC